MLEIQNISKSFNQKIALDDVSMTINKGEIFGMLGPNGAGKTTLIRIINKIIVPNKGVIRFNGDIMSQKHLSNIGYLPEERGLYKNMTVESHALFLGQLRGLTKADVKQKLDYWLEKFKIQNWRDKRIEELSKGMAQKVQFICTILHEPSLLILDEPCSGLDDEMAAKFTALIAMIAAETNTAIIYVSHKEEEGLLPEKVFQLIPAFDGSTGRMLW